MKIEVYQKMLLEQVKDALLSVLRSNKNSMLLDQITDRIAAQLGHTPDAQMVIDLLDELTIHRIIEKESCSEDKEDTYKINETVPPGVQEPYRSEDIETILVSQEYTCMNDSVISFVVYIGPTGEPRERWEFSPGPDREVVCEKVEISEEAARSLILAESGMG